MSLPWIFLTIAGILEVCWAMGLKFSQGFTKPIPTVFTAVTLIFSMYFLAKAAETLPLGTAYAVWVGIGAVGTVILGIIVLKEPVTIARLVFVTMLITSIIGLKITAPN